MDRELAYKSAIDRMSVFLDTPITDVCILYPYTDSFGYGSVQVSKNGKHYHFGAHRLSYDIFNNSHIDSSIIVIHSCDTPACVNPNHLSIGTHTDNVNDKVSKGRQAKGELNGRYKHGYYSIYNKVEKKLKSFTELYGRSLNEDIVKSIKTDINSGRFKSLVQLAKYYNIPYQTVKDIKCKRSYINVLV